MNAPAGHAALAPGPGICLVQFAKDGRKGLKWPAANVLKGPPWPSNVCACLGSEVPEPEAVLFVACHRHAFAVNLDEADFSIHHPRCNTTSG